MTASELFSALRWLEIQVEVPVVHDLLRRLDSDDDGRLNPEVSPISLHDRPYSFTEAVHGHEPWCVRSCTKAVFVQDFTSGFAAGDPQADTSALGAVTQVRQSAFILLGLQ